ncbi:hypothetical protein [Massilia sp. UBA6681]|nr:hypothetical protein [Massilia sp. UBA6681]
MSKRIVSTFVVRGRFYRLRGENARLLKKRALGCGKRSARIELPID